MLMHVDGYKVSLYNLHIEHSRTPRHIFFNKLIWLKLFVPINPFFIVIAFYDEHLLKLCEIELFLPHGVSFNIFNLSANGNALQYFFFYAS